MSIGTDKSSRGPEVEDPAALTSGFLYMHFHSLIGILARPDDVIGSSSRASSSMGIQLRVSRVSSAIVIQRPLAVR